jgi:hypothetical protein
MIRKRSAHQINRVILFLRGQEEQRDVYRVKNPINVSDPDLEKA